VMDRCLSEEPSLRVVGEDAFHSSACWLPVEAAGLSDRAEELRKETVREGRSVAAAEVAEAIAAAPESEGSVI
jgi:peptide/nickel transport system ATP-binding protein